MNALALVQIALSILSAVAPQLKVQGLGDAADGLEKAIAELQKVHDTPVTHEQLQALKVPQVW